MDGGEGSKGEMEVVENLKNLIGKRVIGVVLLKYRKGKSRVYIKARAKREKLIEATRILKEYISSVLEGKKFEELLSLKEKVGRLIAGRDYHIFNTLVPGDGKQEIVEYILILV